MSNHSLNLKGLRCPQVVLSISKYLKNLNSSDKLEILTDDPFAYVDIGSVWEIESKEQKDDHQIINIIKR